MQRQFVGSNGNRYQRKAAQQKNNGASYKSWYKNPKKTQPAKPKKEYRLGIEISESDLDDLLNDKLDIEDFLKS